jgi:2-methylcitrate dehydratase PrpD
MTEINRRGFVSAGALGVLGLLPAVGSARADAQEAARASDATADVTRTLAAWVVSARPEDLPAPVKTEACRTLVNYVGCAVGGSRHETMDIAIRALAPFSGPAQASVLGRREKLDILHAALMNGISSHVFDFDDTHLKTIIHPGGPVASAILGLAETQPVSGREFLHALVLGVEVECRIGNAVYPAHYDRGWHITGTAGVFGAAAAAGRILKLSEQQMRWALGLAATQPVGLREMFGTMTKSFHPGRAAQNGLTAAILAKQNFTSSEAALEAKSGWARVLSTSQNYNEITQGLGQRFEILLNTYKPFACGIVLHPAIDACIQLRAEHQLTPAAIERIDLAVHPLVLELTGKKTPATGLEGKFSVYFAAAIAIATGAAGVKQFTDQWVRDAAVVALRDRVTATVDPAIHETQVRAVITLKDGRRLEKRIEHALGSTERPLSDQQLDTKVRDLCDGILPADRVTRMIGLCRAIEREPTARVIADSARPV